MSTPAVLIIDDESSVQSVLEEILNGRGYDIYLAKNGEEGLQKFKEFSPDVVLLDLNMPEMDGFAFLEAVKPSRLDSYEVIVITGNTENRKVVKCYDLGAESILRKPFFAAEVRRVVEHSLERKKMLRESKNPPSEFK
ncbi:MAG: hypothetical protein A2020_13665 [Lentisphaerae bacterium GWF2_45_14]|nr:MAG: hypothetical protein A2020_13665 [Lentisphaerae bacterium GWF2_45_14]